MAAIAVSSPATPRGSWQTLGCSRANRAGLWPWWNIIPPGTKAIKEHNGYNESTIIVEWTAKVISVNASGKAFVSHSKYRVYGECSIYRDEMFCCCILQVWRFS